MADVVWPGGVEDVAATVRDDERAVSVVGLRMTLAGMVGLDRVPAAFGDEPASWLGEPAGTDGAGLRRFRGDLRLRVSPESRALFRKAAIISLGVPRASGGGWAVPIEWQAATLAPLFPMFVGTLHIERRHVALDGYYAPPFGVIGYVVDRAVLSIAARGTARWLLTQVLTALR
jgi:hypothetical protein